MGDPEQAQPEIKPIVEDVRQCDVYRVIARIDQITMQKLGRIDRKVIG
ncbi:MAG: hypothetical protein AOA66_0930 [Candidatus Bathyarchaeota archaeon BA2]|nr:MAG: hypothetical protein AOA66_0930 [Candidatus Bathyarchaeota archaeon BA2]